MSITGLTRRQALKAATAAGALGLGPGAPSTQAFAQELSGSLTAWDFADGNPVGNEAQAAFYDKYFPSQAKGLNFSSTMYGYGDLLPKLTVAWRAGSKPDVVRVPVAWSPQLVGLDQCAEITEEELGFPFSQFLPQALLSMRKHGASDGALYGVPTNNETLLLLYNKGLFRQAGLDPEKPPATWAELADFSKAIHDKTGAYGFGLCAQQNYGDTPFRFMPVAWAYGGQIFDELSPNPTWRTVGLGDEGVIAALALYNRMLNVDKSVQPSALNDNSKMVQPLFLAGKCAMCLDHPPFALQIKSLKPDLELGAAMLPAGPVRRAAVMGGSNMHIRATTDNKPAALALMKAFLSPYWNARLAVGTGSEASTQAARDSEEMKSLSEVQPFSDIVFQMLPYAVNVPLVPQGAQIWNMIVPAMIQQVLAGQGTPKEAAGAAAGKVSQLMTG